MAAQSSVDVGGIFRPQGALDPATALQPYPLPLSDRLAAHLLRRAGFGGTPDEVRRYTGIPVRDAVASLLRLPPADSIAAPGVYDSGPDFEKLRTLGSPADVKARIKRITRAQRASIVALRLWWLNQMLTTPAPLQEKMTLYFHGHFTTYVDRPMLVYRQNRLFRSYALGNLRALTHDISKDPAMLAYLNGNKNVAAHPNENYARESMELFTLGLGHYTEQDVRESARAWTGWRVNLFTEQAWFSPSLHDYGSKTFLGRTGNFDGDDIVDIIFAQPQCARFFANSLLNWFVYNDPEPELVDGVAALLREHDYELAPVVSVILSSNVFHSARAYRALVKSPAEFVVGTYKTLGLPQIDMDAVAAMREMGQVLFQPPNVAGWPGGQNWLSSGTMVARQNFLSRIVNSQTLDRSSWLQSVPMRPRTAARALVSTMLQRDASAASLAQLDAYLSGAGSSALAALSPENYPERISAAAYLALATPAYQLN